MLARFEGVGHRYGELSALGSLDLEVRNGEVFGLLGPNGAGKTTALRILVGQIRPTAGRVLVDGIDVHADPLAARRRFSYVPDGAPLYANLSPREHLELVGALHQMRRSEVEQVSVSLLDAFALGDRRDDPVGDFSRGMRQKVALACALLPEPVLLVLDEPMTGLDAPTATVLKELLRAWADRGGAVLYTSHLLDVVERICDRMGILHRGELAACGTLAELRSKAGEAGTLEQVFGVLTQASDPAAEARRILSARSPLSA
jgi:ABC-2 type transport system ATP-binding protein